MGQGLDTEQFKIGYIIKKRKKPLRPLEIFVNAGAMNAKGVLEEDGRW